MIAIRGAVRVRRNDREAIYGETRGLLEEIQRLNEVASSSIVSALFTMTPDLNADFPAYAARSMGWTEVPMLGAVETAVPGALDRVVRVMLLVDVPGPARHVYLGETAAMRPDLAGVDSESRRLATLSGDAMLVVGLGMIGGSLAMAVANNGNFGMIDGQDTDARALELAKACGAISNGSPTPEPFLSEPRTIVLALPVDAILDWLDRWGAGLAVGTIVLDVGSTKSEIVASMDRLPPGVEAIGTHPMAGSEASGIRHARPDLFAGSSWALVETARTGPAARRAATAIVDAAGARAVFLAAEEHDRAVATTSHLPYLLAAGLALHTAAADGPTQALSGSGLRDMTRLAASDPAMMAGILATNRANMTGALRSYLDRLTRLAETLEQAAPESGGPTDAGSTLLPLLGQIRSAREALF